MHPRPIGPSYSDRFRRRTPIEEICSRKSLLDKAEIRDLGI